MPKGGKSMSKLFVIMILLPVISMVLAGFMGYLKTLRTFFFALILMVIGYGAGFDGVMKMVFGGGPWAFIQTLLGLALMFGAPWLTFFASLRNRRVSPAPVDHVIKAAKDGTQAAQAAWNNVDPAKKEKILEVSKKMASHGFRHGARVLRRKGHLSLAALILSALHII
jgi:hypothetical protein